MNLFILFDDAIKSAQAHGDKHVVKMILETASRLSLLAAGASVAAVAASSHPKRIFNLLQIRDE
jgi:hypothetical protein